MYPIYIYRLFDNRAFFAHLILFFFLRLQRNEKDFYEKGLSVVFFINVPRMLNGEGREKKFFFFLFALFFEYYGERESNCYIVEEEEGGRKKGRRNVLAQSQRGFGLYTCVYNKRRCFARHLMLFSTWLMLCWNIIRAVANSLHRFFSFCFFFAEDYTGYREVFYMKGGCAVNARGCYNNYRKFSKTIYRCGA